MDQPAKKCQNASNFDDEKRMVWGSLKNCYRLNKMAQSELKLEKTSTSRRKKKWIQIIFFIFSQLCDRKIGQNPDLMVF